MNFTDHAAITQYRREHPLSRAVGCYVNAGGGMQRRYVCTFCRCVIDTESARYPMTKHAHEAIREHRARCASRKAYAHRYVVESVRSWLTVATRPGRRCRQEEEP